MIRSRARSIVTCSAGWCAESLGTGNCIGVPDVGGEIYFDPSYSHNPLVNAMCVGLISKDRLASAAARVPDSVLLLAGADTGRDGIHGASGLASRTFEEEVELRPTVQVGNPFLEKVLIEACLEALDTGAVLAIQDLGAAGLTSATIESVARGRARHPHGPGAGAQARDRHETHTRLCCRNRRSGCCSWPSRSVWGEV